MKKIMTLSNGLTVLLDQNDRSIDVGICVAIAAGSRFEPKDKSGIAHILEHLMADENARFQTHQEFANALDRLTRAFSAETYREFVTFTFKTTRSSVIPCIDLAANIVLKPRLRRNALDREIRRICEAEELIDRDSNDKWIHYLVEEMVFMGNGLGNTISGDISLLRSINTDDIRNWYRKVISARRTVVAMVGNFDADKVSQKIRDVFGRMTEGAPFTIEPFQPGQRRIRLRLINQPTRIVQIAIAFPTFGFDHPQRITLSVMNNHLGSLRRYSSRLFQRLAGENGLVYGVCSDLWHFSDSGKLTISAGSKCSNLIEVMRIIAEEIAKLKEKKLTSEELWLAKKSLKEDAREMSYNAMETAQFFAQQLLATNEVISADQFIRSINKIRAIDIKRMARKIFRPGKMNVILIGPVQSLDRRQVIAALRLGIGR